MPMNVTTKLLRPERKNTMRLALLFLLIIFTGCKPPVEPKPVEPAPVKVDSPAAKTSTFISGLFNTTEVPETNEDNEPLLDTEGETITISQPPFFAFPRPGFWFLFAITFVLVVLFAEYDAQSYESKQRKIMQAGNFTASILMCVLLYCNWRTLFDLWEYYGWKGILCVVGIFVVSAILNLGLKWWLKTNKALELFKKREKSFLEKEYPDSAAMEKRKDMIQARDEFFTRHKWSLHLPQKIDNKALLTKWAYTAPISLPGTLILNGAQFSGAVIYRYFGKLADMITTGHERQIIRQEKE